MPSLSPTMSEGSIVKWYKAEGEEIQPGDVLCDIQTDKAVVSLENEEEGVLAKIIKDESVGDIKVGEIIALYVDQGEDWRSVDAEVSSESHSDDVSSESSASASSESVRHTSILGPAVRNIRNTYDVDLSKVTPTGPQKNVLKEDILQYIKANNLKPKDFIVAPPHATSEKKQSKKTKALSVTSQPANEFIDIPLSETALQNMQFLTASKMATPHSYVYYDAGLDDLECLQERLLVEEGVSTELEDLIAKCVGHAMMLCPRLRCVHSSEDSVTQCDRADICWINVCEDGGSVMGSVLHDVGSAPLNDISSARQHQHVALSRELISPSTAAVPITVTSFVSCSVGEVTETLLHPQCASLTVGGRHVRVGAGGQCRSCVSLSLTYDAGIVAEVEAVEFMECLVALIETPRLLYSLARSRELP